MRRKKWILKSDLLPVVYVRRRGVKVEHKKEAETKTFNKQILFKRERKFRSLIKNRAKRNRKKVRLIKKYVYSKIQRTNVDIAKQKTLLKLHQNFSKKNRINSFNSNSLTRHLIWPTLKKFINSRLIWEKSKTRTSLYKHQPFTRKTKRYYYKSFTNRLKKNKTYRQVRQQKHLTLAVFNNLTHKLQKQIYKNNSHRRAVLGLFFSKSYFESFDRKSIDLGGNLPTVQLRTHVLDNSNSSHIPLSTLKSLPIKNTIKLKYHLLIKQLLTKSTFKKFVFLKSQFGLNTPRFVKLLGTLLNTKSMLRPFSMNRSKLHQLPILQLRYNRALRSQIPNIVSNTQFDNVGYLWHRKKNFSSVLSEINEVDVNFWSTCSAEYNLNIMKTSHWFKVGWLEFNTFFNTKFVSDLTPLMLGHDLPYRTHLLNSLIKRTVLAESLTMTPTKTSVVLPQTQNSPLKNYFSWSYKLNHTNQRSVDLTNEKNQPTLKSKNYYTYLAINDENVDLRYDDALFVLTNNIKHAVKPNSPFITLLKNQNSINRIASLAALDIRKKQQNTKIVKKPIVFTYIASTYYYLTEPHLTTINNRNWFYWNTTTASTTLNVTNRIAQTPFLLNWNEDGWENSLYVKPSLASNLNPTNFEEKIISLVRTLPIVGGDNSNESLNAEGKAKTANNSIENKIITTFLKHLVVKVSNNTHTFESKFLKFILKKIKNLIYKKKITHPTLRMRVRNRDFIKQVNASQVVQMIKKSLLNRRIQWRVRRKFIKFIFSNKFTKIIQQNTSKKIAIFRNLNTDLKTLTQKSNHSEGGKKSKNQLTDKKQHQVTGNVKVDINNMRAKRDRTYKQLKNWKFKFILRRQFVKKFFNYIKTNRWFKNKIFVQKRFIFNLLQKKLWRLKRVRRAAAKIDKDYQLQLKSLKTLVMTKTVDDLIGLQGMPADYLICLADYCARNKLLTLHRKSTTFQYSVNTQHGFSILKPSNTSYMSTSTSNAYLLSNLFFLNTALSKRFLFKYLALRIKHFTNAPTYNLSDNVFKLLLWDFNVFYFTNRLKVLQRTNLLPTPAFNFNVKRRLLKLFIFRRFPPAISVWYFNMLIRFMEFCTGRKIYLKLNPHIENSLTLADQIQCRLWEWRVASFQRVLGPRIFVNESLRIILLALKYKDPTFLINWIRTMLYRMSFWKYRVLFRYLKFVIRDLFEPNFEKFGLRGFKLRLKGKISVAGNARTRTLRMKIGRTSHSRFNNKIAHSFTLINSFTGVMGFNVWIFF